MRLLRPKARTKRKCTRLVRRLPCECHYFCCYLHCLQVVFRPRKLLALSVVSVSSCWSVLANTLLSSAAYSVSKLSIVGSALFIMVHKRVIALSLSEVLAGVAAAGSVMQVLMYLSNAGDPFTHLEKGVAALLFREPSEKANTANNKTKKEWAILCRMVQQSLVELGKSSSGLNCLIDLVFTQMTSNWNFFKPSRMTEIWFEITKFGFAIRNIKC